jgi:hypothetical protein
VEVVCGFLCRRVESRGQHKPEGNFVCGWHQACRAVAQGATMYACRATTVGAGDLSNMDGIGMDHYPRLSRHPRRRDKVSLLRHGAWRDRTALQRLSSKFFSTSPGQNSNRQAARQLNTVVPCAVARQRGARGWGPCDVSMGLLPCRRAWHGSLELPHHQLDMKFGRGSY